ncbi:transposase [Streptomyces platensis]|uniref:transposase n=1 Tax=Streptomyces platensis TaxID=58346 RepID=UPI0037AD64F0
MRDAIPQAEICYGVKASTEPGLLKLLAESGRCFDGASPSEIDLCPAVEQQMPTAGRPKGLRLPADRRQAAHGIADRAIFGDPHHHLGRPPPTSRMGVPVRAGVPGGGGGGDRRLWRGAVPLLAGPAHRGDRREPPNRAARRRNGKPDPLDAQEAARAVLNGRPACGPRAGTSRCRVPGCSNSPRAPRSRRARRRSTSSRPSWSPPTHAAGRAGGAEERCVAPYLRAIRHLFGGGRRGAGRAPATRITLGLPAQRNEQLTGQIRQLGQRLARLVEHHLPQLPVGIGPDSAATLIVAMGHNPERLHSEASFAALCGVSPIEHSSGRERCWRLNRGGDRQANSALHRMVHARIELLISAARSRRSSAPRLVLARSVPR